MARPDAKKDYGRSQDGTSEAAITAIAATIILLMLIGMTLLSSLC